MDNLSVVLHGIDDIRIENRAKPVPEKGQLLIRVHTVGICGSDVHYWTHGAIGHFVVKEPMVLGHESSGTVEGVGEGVKGFAVGDRVAMEPGVPCGQCIQCKTGRYNLCPDITFFATPPDHGTLARYITHPASYCYKVPENVSFEDAALIEPLSVAIHTCRRAQLEMGQRVLICGAGPIGVLCMLAAKAQGAGKIVMTDLCDNRLALAKKLGADEVINVKGKTPEENREFILSTMGSAPDVTMECTGAAVCIETAIVTTRSGGVIVCVGLGAARIEIPIIEACLREVDIRGIFRYANCYPTAVELLASGRLDLSGLTRAFYDMEDSLEAFKRSQKADVMKVFIRC